MWCGETDFPVRQEIKTTILEWASSGQRSDCSSLFPFYLLCPLVDIVPRFHFVVSISVKEPVIFYRLREGGRGEGGRVVLCDILLIPTHWQLMAVSFP